MKNSEIPAFPIGTFSKLGDYTESKIEHPGMSLRDYFAVHLLAGVLANPTINKVEGGGDDFELLARNGYMLADAMIKEREKYDSTQS